ncbi:sodium/proline symporter PutP [Zophobihabitans entericus]|uniref:Sodium/proline symporter n=2 Tax=Zophobihabitans entericus TaxID=1635327 RepID=A0A6G9IDR8_9GAMM|nr:sodium/proline symporter PutP [Zophobihabitans entericus]
MLITFIVYISGMLIIGLFAFRATTNFGDYILGGRRIGSFVTALSAGASDMSGWLLMGLPGAIFLSGISQSWIAIGLVIGAYLNWLLIAGRLRVFTEVNHNALTLPDYFTRRFNDNSRLLRLLSAVVILIFFTIYCASGIVAGAKLFESTFGMSYGWAMLAGAGATIAYTLIGGFLAVSWTDTIQASLMMFALILTPIMVIVSSGGFDIAMADIAAKSPEYLNMFKGLDFIAIISLLGWGLGYFGQPHILARFMAADSHAVMKNARRISMTWMVLCLAGAIAVGFFGIAYFSGHPESMYLIDDGKHERIFIELSKLLFNPWMAGILLAAILAAVMSTLSCQLLVSASAITEDLYRAFFRPKATQKELVWVGRAMVLVVSIIAMLLAINPDNSVLQLVSHAWAGFGAAFGPVVIFSVFWSRMTRNGALVGMIVGAVTVLVWIVYNWFNLYSLIPGFIFASIAIVIVSVLDQKPSSDIVEHFSRANRLFHNKI